MQYTFLRADLICNLLPREIKELDNNQKTNIIAFMIQKLQELLRENMEKGTIFYMVNSKEKIHPSRN